MSRKLSNFGNNWKESHICSFQVLIIHPLYFYDNSECHPSEYLFLIYLITQPCPYHIYLWLHNQIDLLISKYFLYVKIVLIKPFKGYKFCICIENIQQNMCINTQMSRFGKMSIELILFMGAFLSSKITICF